MHERVRTAVEELFLSEMVIEDRYFLNQESSVLDNIIPESAAGLFDDASAMDDMEDFLDDDGDEDFLFN